MITAFAPAAFQNNAFQISGAPPLPPGITVSDETGDGGIGHPGYTQSDIAAFRRSQDALQRGHTERDNARLAEKKELRRIIAKAYGIVEDEEPAEDAQEPAAPRTAREIERMSMKEARALGIEVTRQAVRLIMQEYQARLEQEEADLITILLLAS